MPLEVLCSRCRGRLLVEQTGVVVACPMCGTHLMIPGAPPAAAAPPAARPPAPPPPAPQVSAPAPQPPAPAPFPPFHLGPTAGAPPAAPTSGPAARLPSFPQFEPPPTPMTPRAPASRPAASPPPPAPTAQRPPATRPAPPKPAPPKPAAKTSAALKPASDTLPDWLQSAQNAPATPAAPADPLAFLSQAAAAPPAAPAGPFAFTFEPPVPPAPPAPPVLAPPPVAPPQETAALPAGVSGQAGWTPPVAVVSTAHAASVESGEHSPTPAIRFAPELIQAANQAVTHAEPTHAEPTHAESTDAVSAEATDVAAAGPGLAVAPPTDDAPTFGEWPSSEPTRDATESAAAGDGAVADAPNVAMAIPAAGGSPTAPAPSPTDEGVFVAASEPNVDAPVAWVDATAPASDSTEPVGHPAAESISAEHAVPPSEPVFAAAAGPFGSAPEVPAEPAVDATAPMFPLAVAATLATPVVAASGNREDLGSAPAQTAEQFAAPPVPAFTPPSMPPDVLPAAVAPAAAVQAAAAPPADAFLGDSIPPSQFVEATPVSDAPGSTQAAPTVSSAPYADPMSLAEATAPTVSFETAPAATPHLETTAPESAPIETAPVEYAPVEHAPVEHVPAAFAPGEAVPVDSAFTANAPVESAAQGESDFLAGAASLTSARAPRATARTISVSQIWVVLVLSYASAVTVMLGYLIFGAKVGFSHQLESLPDVLPKETPAGKVRPDLVSQGAGMPPGHTLRLGQTQRYGNLRVTPLRVVREPAELVHFDDPSQKGPPGEAVLKLFLRMENVSRDQEFMPLGKDLVFARHHGVNDPTRERSNQFVCPLARKSRDGAAVLLYPYARENVWDLKEMDVDRILQPGETFETYLPTDPAGLDRLTGALVWRVHIRKGLNAKTERGVTTLFEVAFHSDQIEGRSDDGGSAKGEPAEQAKPSGT